MTIINLTKLSLWERLKACWYILYRGQFAISEAHGAISGTDETGRPINVRY